MRHHHHQNHLFSYVYFCVVVYQALRKVRIKMFLPHRICNLKWNGKMHILKTLSSKTDTKHKHTSMFNYIKWLDEWEEVLRFHFKTVKVSWKSLPLCLEGLFQELGLKSGLHNEGKGACRGFQRNRTLQKRSKHRITDKRGIITKRATGQIQCSGPQCTYHHPLRTHSSD